MNKINKKYALELIATGLDGQTQRVHSLMAKLKPN